MSEQRFDHEEEWIPVTPRGTKFLEALEKFPAPTIWNPVLLGIMMENGISCEISVEDAIEQLQAKNYHDEEARIAIIQKSQSRNNSETSTESENAHSTESAQVVPSVGVLNNLDKTFNDARERIYAKIEENTTGGVSSVHQAPREILDVAEQEPELSEETHSVLENLDAEFDAARARVQKKVDEHIEQAVASPSAQSDTPPVEMKDASDEELRQWGRESGIKDPVIDDTSEHEELVEEHPEDDADNSALKEGINIKNPDVLELQSIEENIRVHEKIARDLRAKGDDPEMLLGVEKDLEEMSNIAYTLRGRVEALEAESLITELELSAEAVTELNTLSFAEKRATLLAMKNELAGISPIENAEDAKEYIEASKEFEQLSSEKKQEVGWNIHNIGYKLEQLKSKGFAKVYGSVAEKFEEKSTFGRFFTALTKQFSERDAQIDTQVAVMEKMRAKNEPTGFFSKLTNVGYVAGNILKYGRMVTDAVGWSAAAPTRFVMMGSAVAASGLGAAKEARLENEEVKEATRVQDIDQAAEEAWGAYERAMKNKGLDINVAEHSGVSKEELARAYQEGIPKDLLKRLAEGAREGTGTQLSQKLFQKHIAWKARALEKVIDGIDQDIRFTPEERSKEKEKVLTRFGRSQMLQDFDRILGQQGTIDSLAMSVRYGEKGAKAVVYGMMADSIYRIWDHFADAFSAHGEGVGVSGKITIAQESLIQRAAEEVLRTQQTIPEGEIRVPDASTFDAAEFRAFENAQSIHLPARAVVSGDTLWKIMKEVTDANGIAPEGQPHAIAELLKRLTPEELRAIGVSSGNADKLVLGDIIDRNVLTKLFETKQIGGENIFDHVTRSYGSTEAVDVLDAPSTSAHIEPNSANVVWPGEVDPKELEKIERVNGVFEKGVSSIFPNAPGEWERLKSAPVQEFIMKEYSNPGEKELCSRLRMMVGQYGIAPKQGETIEQFYRRGTQKFFELNPAAFEVPKKYL